MSSSTCIPKNLRRNTGIIRAFLLSAIILSLGLTPHQDCMPDSVRTLKDIEHTGVIIEEDDKNVILETQTGQKKIKRSEIKTVSHDNELDNLITLGDYSKDKNEFAKAYYLYKKAFILDPDSVKANNALASINDRLVKTTGTNPLNSTKVVSTYENFTDDPDTIDRTDSEILADQSELSQGLIENFGLVLEKSDNRIVIRQVVPYGNSRASNAGLKNSDILLMLNDKIVDYMGLFGVMEYLINNRSSSINIKLRREVNLWINNKNQINIPELYSLAGFSLLANGKNRFLINKVRPGSETERSGIKSGDILLSINGIPTKNMTKKEIASEIASVGPDAVSLMIEKQLTL